MIRFIVRRLLLVPVLLWVIVTIAFGLIALMPGDPARVIAGELASPEQVEVIRHQLGLDASLINQYFNYIGDLLHGDLGKSLYTNVSVVDDIGTYLPNSLELVILALIVAVVIGLILGAIGAYYNGRAPARIVRGVITVAQSVPDFVTALALIFLFFSVWRLFPAPTGRIAMFEDSPPSVTHWLLVDSLLAGRLDTFLSALGHMVLPIVALAIAYSTAFAKTARATLLPALRSPQVEFARASGLSEWMCLRYAFLEARTPIVTYGAILFAHLIGGVAIIETIFNWQGVGQWALDAMLKLDVPVIRGFILVVGAGTLLVYVALDVIVALLDPRISYGSSR